jgi:hypothetical protein
MAKALLSLANGTVVTIEGTAVEVHELLTFYDSAPGSSSQGQSRNAGAASVRSKRTSPLEDEQEPVELVDLMAIVNHIKSGDEAECIEKNILDKIDQLPRVLLPLYVVYERMGNTTGLTSGEISKVTTELGIRIMVANASTILSGSASKYVIGDKVRKQGHPVRYKLSRRGHAYIKAIIAQKRGDR